MASPQLENGHTRIANEILEKLIQAPILVSELKLVLFIIRKTYGFNKKEDIISISQFVFGTKLSRSSVIRGLKSLVSSLILVRASIPPQNISWKLNKDWEKWLLVSTHRPVSQNNLTSIKHDIELVSTHRHTKDNIQKTITKDISEQARGQPLNEILKPFYDYNPTFNFGNTTQRKALEDILSKIGEEKTKEAVQYALSIQGKKYAPLITTPVQLKNKLGDLRAYYNRSKNSRIIKI